MKLERKVYETRSQKVGDFFLGIGLFIAINVVLAAVVSFVTTLLGGLIVSASNGNMFGNGIGNILFLIGSAIPLVLQIVLLIYFSITRYWIALGMLAAFAIALLIVLLFTAACFGFIFLVSGGAGR